jgi:hypothetical protein
MFEFTSRYYRLETAVFTPANGRPVTYVRRRILPDRGTAVILAQHTVLQGERLDNITARYLTDPEQFWQIADANNAMQPEELTAEIGRQLHILYPQP